MKYIDEFRNKDAALHFAREIEKKAGGRKITLMEVCGTHTMSIHRYGIKKMLPDNVRLLSGPGCPVCVTDDGYMDKAVELSGNEDVIVTTFGDMMRVPGTESSLEKERAQGGDVRIVYSPADAVKTAAENSSKKVVFLGIGFETTSPTIGAAILQAEKEGLDNFSVLCAAKLIPPAMELLVSSGKVGIDGFLCPAHVSTIIGAEPYEFLTRDYHIPCVIGGFEPTDILQSVYQLVEQVTDGNTEVAIQYSRAVKYEGNKKAQEVLHAVFTESDADWRGIGKIEASGLAIREEFNKFNADERFTFRYNPLKKNTGCICGLVLQGLKEPDDCSLYGTSCTPESPVGPCMVSSEGTCAAYYKYS